MAPKVKNVMGSNHSRKGKTSGSSSAREPMQKNGKKVVQRYGWEWFECHKKVKYMGNEFVNEVRLQSQFPVTYQIMIELGLRFTFENSGNCNLTLVREFYNNLRWRFCYGGLNTYFLRAEGTEEEIVDMTISYHPDMTGKLVDVTRTKALDTSYGPILSAQERQTRDDNITARMFGVAEL
ncbi:hypothetical protein H5410_002883 [Solanum commersonii]|uniref:Uncharacterized protein n=1 Tax=Solanum commersonii TaxID=4109 RepID=A0A9J6B360_SOLCO|nr:hypothetical protein H5410_002883 [Solanum commersonii]